MSLADGNIGSIKTLCTMLSGFLSAYDIDVRYGEEFVFANDMKLPCVIVVPNGGPWEQNGYARDTAHQNTDANGRTNVYYDSTSENNRWMTHEDIQLYCWSADVDANGREKDTAQPVDHANAVENLRAKVLQALQQQAPNGLMYRPIAGQWVRASEEVTRYGRAYVLTVNVDITVPDLQPVLADVDEVTITPSIEG